MKRFLAFVLIAALVVVTINPNSVNGVLGIVVISPQFFLFIGS